ncbi:MAG: flagellar export chaperone FliS [Planctomycetota bacterium]
MIPGKKIGNAYLEQEIMTLNPIQLIIKAYDAGIAACNRKDEDKTCAVLVELIDSLNFDHADIANSLFRLYDFCLREVKHGKFDTTLKVLKELRDTWVLAQANIPANTQQLCNV